MDKKVSVDDTEVFSVLYIYSSTPYVGPQKNDGHIKSAQMTHLHAHYSNYIAATHNITHSPCTSTCTPITTGPTAFHNPPLHTTNKTKAYLCKWQLNGTRCRDGVKVLWCDSHLLRLYMCLLSFKKLFCDI